MDKTVIGLVVEKYLKKVDFDSLDENYYELVDILPTDKQKFYEIENG